MYLSNNYIYDISIIPIDYSAMLYKTKDPVFYDFEDEYVTISPPSGPLHNNNESVKIYETPTFDLYPIKNFVSDFLSLVRALTNLIFAVIYGVSGGLGVLAVIVAGIATVLQELVSLNCLSRESDIRHDRESNCLSQIQDKIAESLVGQ